MKKKNSKKHNLFPLMFNLCRLASKQNIVDVFLEALREIWPDINFEYKPIQNYKEQNCIKVSSSKSNYGCIQITDITQLESEDQDILNNAIAMLAVILKKNEQDKLLENEKLHLQKLVDEKVGAIKESEQKFRNVFEHAFIGISITAPDGSLRINKAFSDILGYSESELIKLKWQDITHPDEIDRDEEIFQGILSGDKTSARWVKRYIRKNGEIIWVDITTSLQLDDEGKPQYFITSINDITEYHKAETLLCEGEESLRLSTELANVAVWKYDFNTNNMERSKNHDQLYGLNWQEKWDLSTFNNAIHPDDRELSDSMIQKSIASGGPDEYTFDFRVLFTDQSIHWLNVVGQVTERDSDGQGRIVRGCLIDVTARIQAEEALRESEIKFRSIFENSIDAMGVSKSGKHVFMNPAYLKLFGFSHVDELAQKSITDLIAPREREKISENVTRRNKGEIVANNYETVGLRKDGSEFIMDVHTSFYQLNKEKYTLVILRDITKQKTAESELRDSEERFRNVFEEGPMGIAMAGFKSNVFIQVNAAFCEMLGYTQKEMRHLSFTDVTHPEDRTIDMETVIALKEGKIQKHNTEKRYLKKNGEIIWATRSLNKISGSDNFQDYALAMINDITELKLSEEKALESRSKLKAALDSMNDAVFISDTDGHFIDFNDAFVSFHKFGNKEECAKTFEEYLKILDVLTIKGQRVPLEEWAVPRALSGEIATNVEFILRRKDSKETWIGSYNFAPIVDEGDTIIGAVVTARDITEHKFAEEELNKYKAHLEELVKERTIELEKLNKDLQIKNSELEKFNQLFVDREFRIKELKDEIIELKKM